MKLNCALETSVDRNKQKKPSRSHQKIWASLLPVTWTVQLTWERTNVLTLLVYVWFCFVRSFSSFITSIRLQQMFYPLY